MRNQYNLHELCLAFGVSRSAYRHYQSHTMTQARLKKITLISEVKSINNHSKLKVYGSPRMTAELKSRGIVCSKNTVAKLMQEHQIKAKRNTTYKAPRTTVINPQAKYNPNLIKEQKPTYLGQILVNDITYLRTKEGWLYLSTTMDLYSRAILGYSTSSIMPASLVVDSLNKAIDTWQLSRGLSTYHSDRGSQYSSVLLRDELAKQGFKQSMSDKGNCYDNAHAESFFSSLKSEIMPACGYFETRDMATKAVFDYIDGFYNTIRKHSSLGYLSPYEFIQINQLNKQEACISNQQKLAKPA